MSSNENQSQILENSPLATPLSSTQSFAINDCTDGQIHFLSSSLQFPHILSHNSLNGLVVFLLTRSFREAEPSRFVRLVLRCTENLARSIEDLARCTEDLAFRTDDLVFSNGARIGCILLCNSHFNFSLRV